MPLPTPDDLTTDPNFGVIGTSLDGATNHTTSQQTIPGDYLNQLASDTKKLYAPYNSAGSVPAAAATMAKGNLKVMEPSVYTLSYGDANPVDILTIAATETIIEIEVHVKQAFNGVSPVFKLGTPADDDLFFVAGEVDLAELEQVVSKSFTQAGAATVRLTVNPGAGATSGMVLVSVKRVSTV